MAANEGAPRVRYQLVVQEGPRAGEVIALDQPVLTLGRQRTNDVVLLDDEVSRRHARLEVQGGVLMLWDEASSNGTFLNGAAIVGPTPLHAGDVVEVGTSRFLVQAVAPVVRAPDAVSEPAISPPRTQPPATGEWPAPLIPVAPVPTPAPLPAQPPAAYRPLPPAGSPVESFPPAGSPGEPPSPAATPAAAWPAAASGAGFLGIPPETVRAGFFPRLLAYLIDGVILGVIIAIVLGPFMAPLMALQDPTEAEVQAALAQMAGAYLAVLVVSLIYVPGSWLVWGATIGKKVLGLRIVNASGTKPTVGQVIVRYLGYIPSAFCYLGFLWILKSEKRGWHDLLAGTYVVRAREFAALGPEPTARS
jgi:uncharacterized RDD family membrane protein YckC